MANRVKEFEAWLKARDALDDSVAEVLGYQNLQPFSDSPNSKYRRAGAQLDRLQDQIDRLVEVGLKQVDDSIASGNLITKLDGFAEKAKTEANRLKNATKTLTSITNVVNKVVGIVDKIAGLPFL